MQQYILKATQLEAAWQKRSQESWGHQVEHVIAICLCDKGSQWYPWLQKQRQKDEGGDPSTLFSAGGASLQVLGPVLDSSVRERCGQSAEGPAKDHKDGKGTAASCIQGKAESTCSVQPGREKAQKDIFNVQKCLKGGRKEDRGRFFSEVPSDRTRGKGH